ncbi:YncE family protein [Salinithrix halophila]|uniref:YncE family protein n=1 Tax=Salinithrix halophila TaxID=1485204 RepID=A0ABV8JEC1_9BACL
MKMGRWKTLLGLAVATALTFIPTTDPAGAYQALPERPETRSVLFVGNNWEGTVDIIDPKSFTRLGQIQVIPDLKERQREILTDPVRAGYYLAIRYLVGEGHDQYVDDMFTSRNGRYLYVSRPSLADVVGIDLRTREIVWRVPMEGYRADHMAMSPDGTRLLVSDSTARKVHVIDPSEGRKVAEFESGDSPHESQYSSDGTRIFHASIGHVWSPTDRPIFDSMKGDRWFQIVDAETYQVIKRLNIGEILEDHGYENYSSAVRPMALSPDEKTVYLQLSFLHGFVEFDLENEKPLRIAHLPLSEKAKNTPREQYLLDSAHHGLAMNPRGTKLCVAGTMSNYAAIVDRKTFEYKLFPDVDKPYWATNSADGKYCFVSASGDDQVVVLDYRNEREVARIPVGDHPQRMRMGVIHRDYVGVEGSPDHFGKIVEMGSR